MIRIVSPSGAIEAALIDSAAEVLRSWGHEVSIGQYACERYGRFAGTVEQRIADLQAAIDDTEVDTILCSRGGYGLAQIIDQVDFAPLLTQEKLVVGLSDITILHSALAQHNIVSLHSIMCKQISELSEDAEAKTMLRQALDGRLTDAYRIAPHPLNRYGVSEGRLRGGNLSVVYGLRGTPYDIRVDEPCILFIEDIAENAYHIDRMVQNLRLGGVFERISGLVVGQMTDCPEDESMRHSIYEGIRLAVSDYDFPVLFDFPAGHVDRNYPLLMNGKMRLEVSAEGSQLSVIQA